MTLLAAFKSQSTDVSPTKSVRSRSSSVANSESGAPFRSPGKTAKSAHEGVIPSSEVTKAVRELQEGSSKH